MKKAEKRKAAAGGPVAIRGYLVQTLVALLDALAPGQPFETVTLEPDDEQEKVDIRWEYADGSRRFVQVRSTKNYFSAATVKRWNKEFREAEQSLQADSPAEWVLWLVGNCEKGVFELTDQDCRGIRIEHTSSSLDELRDQACHGIARLFESVNVVPPSTEAQALLVRAIALRLAEDSTRGTKRTRQELTETLLTWAALTRIERLKIASSRLPYLHGNVFVDRDKELEQLDKAWDAVLARKQDRPRVITLVAWAGVGKTALLTQWMASLAKRDWLGAEVVFDWSFYSQGTHEQGAASADAFIAAALEFFGGEEGKKLANSPASPWEKGQRLAEYVHQKRSLLLLDGIEPLQHPPGPLTGRLKDPMLESLLKGLARYNVGLCIVTTREHLADLDPFRSTTAPEWRLEHLSEDASTELLCKCGVKGHDAELRDASREVAGHALTLHLLGSFLARVHHGDIRKRSQLRLEKADAAVQGGHAFRVAAAYENWLVQSGEEGVRQLAILRLLGLFDRPADASCLAALRQLPAIAGLTDSLVGLNDDDWNFAVSALAELGFVHVRIDEPNTILNSRSFILDAHPLIREYFAKRLRETNPEAWRIAHRRLYEHLKASTPDKPQPDINDLQPLYQAVAHGCKAGLEEETYSSVYRKRIQKGDDYYSFHRIGAFGAILGALSNFFEVTWSVVTGRLPLRDRAELLNNAGYCLWGLGRNSEAIQALSVAYKTHCDICDWKEAAIDAENLGEIHLTGGQITEALELARKGVEYADASSKLVLRIDNNAILGHVLHQAGRFSEAKHCFLKANQIRKQMKNSSDLTITYPGFLYLDFLCDLGEYKKAFVFANDFLRFHSQAQPILRVALNYLVLARVKVMEGIHNQANRSRARQFLTLAMEGLRTAGRRQDLPRGLLTCAWLHVLEGDDNGARTDLDEAWQIAESGHMWLHMADIHLCRARLFRDVEELKKAREIIECCGYWRRKKELEEVERAKCSESWRSYPTPGQI